MAWNLGFVSAEEYQRAVALKPVSSERPEAAVSQQRSGRDALEIAGRR